MADYGGIQTDEELLDIAGAMRETVTRSVRLEFAWRSSVADVKKESEMICGLKCPSKFARPHLALKMGALVHSS